MTPGATASVLVVEDSDEDFDTVADAAARLQVPYALVRVLSVDDGLAALLSGQPFRLVILDNSLPGDRGDVFLSAEKAPAALPGPCGGVYGVRTAAVTRCPPRGGRECVSREVCEL